MVLTHVAVYWCFFIKEPTLLLFCANLPWNPLWHRSTRDPSQSLPQERTYRQSSCEIARRHSAVTMPGFLEYLIDGCLSPNTTPPSNIPSNCRKWNMVSIPSHMGPYDEVSTAPSDCRGMVSSKSTSLWRRTGIGLGLIVAKRTLSFRWSCRN